MKVLNLFDHPPRVLDREVFELLVDHPRVRIERIVSRGHASPESGWYDQERHEWVAVVQGHAVLEFEQGGEVELHAGDHIDIPAHTRHRVRWTTPDRETIWLAVHYG